MPRRYQVRSWLGALALLVAGGTAGYALGPGSAGKVDRAREALTDAALPAVEAATERERTELVRAELHRFARLQEQFRQNNGRYRNYDEAVGPEGFEMLYDAGGDFWMAQMHLTKHRHEWCAVMVGKSRAYSNGIALKRSGEVRCARDLATRINALLSRVLPVRFSV